MIRARLPARAPLDPRRVAAVGAAGVLALSLVTGVTALTTVGTIGRDARADVPLPPWVEDGEAPPPAWARAVAPRPGERGRDGDLVVFGGPSRASGRRGVTAGGVPLPFYGTKRGSGCSGTWWLVGPLAWVCSDDAALSADAPIVPPGAGVPALKYAFVGTNGASAYASLDQAEEGEADHELEGGWSVAVADERQDPRTGERWSRTTKGEWIASRALAPMHPSVFHGEAVEDGRLDVAWVTADRASTWAAAPAFAPGANNAASAHGAAPKDKPNGARARFTAVHVRETSGAMVRVDDGAWMLARDLARPTTSPAPLELGAADEHWIEVDRASQTLVAYEGVRPVYATMVSTGRDAAHATPQGIHRIWVKLATTDMANVDRNDTEAHYSLQDVPYVQFFDDAVGLHGTYWHGDFGRPKSHGCVNVSIADARWLFDFTGPKLPAGWVAVYPTSVDGGTLVRVR